jgi:Stress responsive A/B Barrel Domain
METEGAMETQRAVETEGTRETARRGRKRFVETCGFRRSAFRQASRVRRTKRRVQRTQRTARAQRSTWVEGRTMISHIVLFEPKPGLTSDEIMGFAQQLKTVIDSVPSIARATIGRTVSIENGQARNFGDKTYSFSAVVEFADEKGLTDYLNHPAHRALGRLFWQYCAATVVSEMESIDAKVESIIDFLVRTQK